MLRNIFQLLKLKGQVNHIESQRNEPGAKKPLVPAPVPIKGKGKGQRGKTYFRAKADIPPPQPPALSASEQTMELLQGVEPEDILELMFPRLILEQQRQLEAVDQELAQIDKRLAALHLRRDDVLEVNSPTNAS